MKSTPIAYTDRDIAAILKVSVKHVQELLRRGSIPGSRKIGRFWRISAQAFHEWWDGKEVSTQRPVVVEMSGEIDEDKPKIKPPPVRTTPAARESHGRDR